MTLNETTTPDPDSRKPNVLFFNPPRGQRWQELSTRWFGRQLRYVFYCNDIDTFREITGSKAQTWALLVLGEDPAEAHLDEIVAMQQDGLILHVVIEASTKTGSRAAQLQEGIQLTVPPNEEAAPADLHEYLGRMFRSLPVT